MPVPVCRTVQEAYDAGRADALATPAGPDLAAKMAELIMPLLEQIAAHRHKLITVAEAAGQLGMGKTAVYHLMYRGEFASVEIPSENGGRPTRRIEQSEIDAFVARYRVRTPKTRGGAL